MNTATGRQMGYWAEYADAGRAHRDIVADLFTRTTDFSQRALFNCDHVAAAVLLEALWFGLRRRGEEPGFNAVMDRAPPYVFLGPLSGQTGIDMDWLFADDADPYSENLLIPTDDLQVGDMSVVLNNYAYYVLGSGVWANEYSFVQELPTNWLGQSSVTDDHLKVAGHGIATKTLRQMRDSLLTELNALLRGAREVIPESGPEFLIDYNDGIPLLKWNPYGDFTGFVPWWLVIEGVTYRASPIGLNDLATAKFYFPGAYGKGDVGPQAGWPTILQDDDLLLPLYQPRMKGVGVNEDPWAKYFGSRIAGDRGSVGLDVLKPDARYAPGPFRPNGMIAVVRPKLRMT